MHDIDSIFVHTSEQHLSIKWNFVSSWSGESGAVFFDLCSKLASIAGTE